MAALGGALVGIVGGGLQAGYITFAQAAALLPLREARQLARVVAQHHAARAGRIVQQRHCAAIGCAVRPVKVNLLDVAGRGLTVGVPVREAGHGGGVARRGCGARQQQARARIHKRRAKVAVIEQLHLGRHRLAVFNLIGDQQRV